MTHFPYVVHLEWESKTFLDALAVIWVASSCAGPICADHSLLAHSPYYVLKHSMLTFCYVCYVSYTAVIQEIALVGLPASHV